MNGIAGFNALKCRMTLESGNVVKTEDLILDIMPKYEPIKREDILYRFFNKYGRQYDNDSVRSEISAALRRMCKHKQLVKEDHGIYSMPAKSAIS